MQGAKYLKKKVKKIEAKSSPMMTAFTTRIAFLAGGVLFLILLGKAMLNFSAEHPSSVDLRDHEYEALDNQEARFKRGSITHDEWDAAQDSVIHNNRRDCIRERKGE